MRKLIAVLIVLTAIVTLSPAAFATNGTLLIGVGPVSRSMGGVGVAAPQDAIGAVFANPAAMCFGPYCPSSQFDFAGTLFMPEQKATITASGQSFSAHSNDQVYAIPAIGFSVPIGEAESRWRFGLSAYGISGLGVDYRNTAIDQPAFYDFDGNPNTVNNNVPLAAGTYTNLQLMKFAPTIGWQATNQLSVGAAVHINYSSLDLGGGTSPAYSLGVQLGALYKPLDQLSLGLTYITPQEAKYDNVADLNGDGAYDNLKLEQPQQLALGIAYEFLEPGILLEANGRWVNWSNAKGFEDFDWRDQWVLALGGQYEVIDHLFLRLGYNYAKNPVKSHNGWNGNFLQAGGPDTVDVQGKAVPVYAFETLRMVGFPAFVEQHLTTGVGYEFGEHLIINLSYMHAFENSMTENGTAADGSNATVKSKLYEDSLTFSFSWRF